MNNCSDYADEYIQHVGPDTIPGNKFLKHLSSEAASPSVRRRGFSLVEIITAVAVLAVLAGIVMYSYSPQTANDRERYAAVADALADIAVAINEQDPMATASTTNSFFRRVGAYPGKLSDLTDPITTAEKNLCGASFYTAAQVSAWKPFYSRDLRDGTPLARGFAIQDALVLVRKPTSGLPPSPRGTFAIRFPTVDTVDAKGLDVLIDGTLSAVNGQIAYSTTAATTPVLYYMPFGNWGTGSGC